MRVIYSHTFESHDRGESARMAELEGLQSTEGQSSFLVAALRKLLRPLVRLLLSQRLTFPSIASLLKQLYVEVAVEELHRGEQNVTDSRVSLMTGVHRKDVRRFRSEVAQVEDVPAAASRGSRVVQLWMTSPEYQDATGNPLPLPRTSADPKAASFDRLAASISTDVRPRAVLEDLVDLGVVEIDEAGQVHLRVAGFVPNEGFDEKVFFFGRSTRDHIAAAVHNLLAERPPMLERSVYYEGLSEDSVAELETLSRELAMESLKAVNKRAASLKRRDANHPHHTFFMNFGAYFRWARREDA